MCFQLCDISLVKRDKVNSVKELFAETGVEELNQPAQSLDFDHIKCLWDESECQLLWARPYCPKLVPDLTDAPMAEWKEIPAAMFQNIKEGKEET